MKKFITINQTNFVEIGKREGIKVDAIDGILFDWIRTFMLSDNALKKLIDNELYIWVSYRKIREDNPLCNINTNDVIGRRLNKLEKLGLIKKFVSKEDGNKTFIALTKFAYTYLLEDRELPTQESGDYRLKSRELPTQESDNSKLIESYDSKLIDNLSISFFFSDNQCSGKNHTCKRKAAMKINDKYYCSQHGRMELSKLGKLDLLPNDKKEKMSKNEKFKNLLLDAFKAKKILALKDKINISKCTDALKEIEDEELEQIAKDYALYVQTNKKMASRLDKYLWAYVAKDMSLVNYANDNKPQSAKTANDIVENYYKQKENLFGGNFSGNNNSIDVEVS